MTEELKDQLEEYLLEHIPISQSMGIEVAHASNDKIILRANFLKNINHKKTVFGGSLHAVATLGCWCLLHTHLRKMHSTDIVITSSQVDYIAPVTSDFHAQCNLPDEAIWKSFMKMLDQKGKARIKLESKIFQNEKLAVDYIGTFAAIKRSNK